MTKFLIRGNLGLEKFGEAVNQYIRAHAGGAGYKNPLGDGIGIRAGLSSIVDVGVESLAEHNRLCLALVHRDSHLKSRSWIELPNF